MSDDFEFDRDLFDDDDEFGEGDFDGFGDEFGEDDFGGEIIDDDDFGNFGDDDEFDDDEFGSRLDFLDDDDEFDGDGDDDESEPVVQEEGNNNFLIAMIAMAILFVLGLLLILFLMFGGFTNNGQAQATQIAFEASSTAVAIENETRQAQVEESATAAVLNVTATRQAALDATSTSIVNEGATSEAGIVASATALVANITATQSAAVEATDSAIGTATQFVIDEEQQFVISATETAISVEQTLNPPAPNVTVDPSLLVTIAPANGNNDENSSSEDGNNDASLPTAIPVTVDENGDPVVIIVVDPISLTPIPVQVDPNAPTVDPAIPTVIVTQGSSDVLIDPADATSTAEALDIVPTSGAAISLPAVQQTATALAQLFLTPTPNALVPTTDPASVVVTEIGGAVVVATPADTALGNNAEALPDTGLFDDVFGGNPFLIVLVAFGLLGVIILSRTVRSTNRDV